MDSPAATTTASREVTALLSASPRPVVLLSPDLTILAASDAYLTAMNVTRADIAGRDIRDVLANSDSLSSLVGSIRTVLRTREPHQIDAGLFRAATDRSQGHQRLMEVINSPVLLDDGEPRWVIMSTREVAQPGPTTSPERLAMEVALHAAEARLRSILRTVPDAMIIIDERGLIESISTTAERLFGYSAEEVVGKNVSTFMPSPDRERHDGYLNRYLATGERHIIGVGRIVVGQRKDGTTFPLHLTVGELRTGEKHYFTGFIRDLTDQQVVENRLKELQSEVTHMSRFTALGEMASTLAHEINQPLTAINNYLKGCRRLLEREEGGSAATLRDAVSKAADQALRAGDIIRRLREFVARGESERRIESLPKLIEDASTLALIGAKENGIAVSFRLDPKADQVLADRIQIQQVLVNLIRNAIDVLTEAPGQREVEIATAAGDDAMAQISVSDTGGGLAPEVAAHLFQPFVTTKQTGMGLGLSICRTIVEAHGGRIWVESRPQGGTIFRFTLKKGHEEEEADVA
jgi:two-component system, LuxR family, sensor kinase FixL